ncbi:MAG TPA: NnrU family protein, partial [Methyloceanibacter sp.]|nr:NnrU family protein [Methyloceanibacter sp.]
IAAYLPGEIKAKVKHPFLVAIKTWALAHLIANGDLASIILFGSFLAYAVFDRIALKRRAVAVAPEVGLKRNDVIAVVGGLLLYVVFLVWLHPMFIGSAPLPSG